MSIFLELNGYLPINYGNHYRYLKDLFYETRDFVFLCSHEKIDMTELVKFQNFQYLKITLHRPTGDVPTKYVIILSRQWSHSDLNYSPSSDSLYIINIS